MLLWNWIVTTRVKGITSQHAPASHQRSLERAVLINCLVSIVRTGRIKAAGVFRKTTRNSHLIKANKRKYRDARPVSDGTWHIAQAWLIRIIVKVELRIHAWE